MFIIYMSSFVEKTLYILFGAIIGVLTHPAILLLKARAQDKIDRDKLVKEQTKRAYTQTNLLVDEINDKIKFVYKIMTDDSYLADYKYNPTYVRDINDKIDDLNDSINDLRRLNTNMAVIKDEEIKKLHATILESIKAISVFFPKCIDENKSPKRYNNYQSLISDFNLAAKEFKDKVFHKF